MLSMNHLLHRRVVAPAVLTLVLACLAPATGQAKDGGDDGGSNVVVPAAVCIQIAGEAGARSVPGGVFSVTGGATAALICPLPSDDLDSSPGNGGKPVTFQVSYLDSDAGGEGAVVGVELLRTQLDPTLADGPDGFKEVSACTWSASGGSMTGTQASFTCPPLAKGGFYHLRAALSAAAGQRASFGGIAAHK